MENIFKTFNKDFFKSVKNITWYDKQGVMELDENRVVTLTVSELGHSDNYVGYNVEIISKNTGAIVKKFFKFQDHLSMINRGSDNYYHVWLNRGSFDWYVSYPRNTKEMCDVIMDWINKFK